jgi:acyl carrier protein
MSNNTDTLSRIQEIIADQLDVDQCDVQPEADLIKDLGADSLDQVAIIMALEDEFDFEIFDEVSEELSRATIARLVEYVDSRLKE